MYKHILIPRWLRIVEDGNSGGIALAKALAGRVTVLTVTTPFHVLTGNPGMVTDTPEQYKEHTATLVEQYLNVAKNIAATAGVPCDVVHIEHGHPYKAIIEIAQNRGCGAIQMASHGRRGFSAILLGSETLKVLTHSTIPVIVCRRPHVATLVQEAFAS